MGISNADTAALLGWLEEQRRDCVARNEFAAADLATRTIKTITALNGEKEPLQLPDGTELSPDELDRINTLCYRWT